MALYDSRLSMIVEQLGRYYSVVSKERFMSILAFGGENPVSDFGKVNLDPTPEHEKIIRIFTDATEGGAIMAKSLEELKGMFDGLDAEEKSARLNLIQNMYRYIGEPESFGGVWEDYETVCSNISITDLCKLKADSAGSKDGTTNGAFGAPTKFTPNLCALQIFNPKLVPAARDSGVSGLFMNCLPTLELSRCQPYLDITLVTPQNGRSDDGRIQTIGLMQHLIGQSKPAELTPGGAKTADVLIADAVNEAAIAGMLEAADVAAAQAKAEGKEEPPPVRVATAGMEMFTSPQTLVPVLGNQMETYGDYETFQNLGGGVDPKTGAKNPDQSVGGRRGAPIIDPFRPLMSIEDFSIGVTPSKGMMSHKTADLSLVLHDRSRMSEIGEFVKPDLFGKTELLITYGWSHPDDSASIDSMPGSPGSGGPPATMLNGNFYGSFLNAMKVTEKYMIVNSSFSFDEVGQVKIKLKLSMKGASNMDTNTIAQGEDIELATKALKDMTDMVKELKRMIKKEAKEVGYDAKDVFGDTFFMAPSSTGKAMSLNEEDAKKIKKFITQNRGAGGAIGDMASALEGMYGKDGNGGAVKKIQDTIASAIGKKLEHLAGMSAAGKDPFSAEVKGHNGSTKFVNIDKNSNSHISYGSLLLYMVGKPLAATKRFDEIQFIFYPMNDKSSYLKDLNTASIPINILNFMDTFMKNTKTDVNLPLGRFMAMVGKEFIHNQAAECFGLASLYEIDKEDGKKKIKKDIKEKPGQLADEKRQRLEDAYGAGQDLTFKMPRVGFHIEAVPAKAGGHEEGRRATILRIHVYDKVCTPHTALGKLITASSSKDMGLVTTKASAAARDAKNEKKTDSADIPVDHKSAFYEQLKRALDAGLLEAVPALTKAEQSNFDPAKLENTYFRIKGGFPALKNFIQGAMPTIIYGSSNSAVLSADVSSMNNPQLASINMMRGGMGSGTTAQGVRDAGVPLQTAPVSLSLTTYGCPVVEYGQSFFVDFGTGTNIDNVYVVSGIDHSISAGKFETKIKMTQVDAFGKYTSMVNNVTKALTALSDTEKK